MDFEKLTIKSKEAIQEASGLAIESGNPEIAPVHLAFVLLDDSNSVIPGVLDSLEIDRKRIINEIAGILGSLPKTQGGIELLLSFVPFQFTVYEPDRIGSLQ